jgi:DNA-binding beta-propeller fold protein YncE
LAVVQETSLEKLYRNKSRYIVFALVTLILAGTVGINLYQSFLYNKIDSREPLNLAEQPSFLYNLNGSQEVTLKEPMGMAVNKKGYIFVSDTGNGRIQVYYPNGKFAWVFGGTNDKSSDKERKEELLNYPYGLAILDNGNLLVADAGTRKIQEFTPKGSFVQTLLPADGTIRPGSATKGQDNNIYVSDLGGHQVLILNGAGKLLEKIKGIEGFQYPQGLAVNKEGAFYLADSGNFRVELLDHKGKVLKTLTGAENGSGFTMVRGLALDKYNRLFVSDTMANQVRVFSPEYKEIFKLNSSPAGGSMTNPTSLTIDNWGRVLIADRSNNRIQVWGYPISKK